MDAIVTAAILGTGQYPVLHVKTGTPVDALTSQLPSDETERTFLLTAGAWALYFQAGHVAAPAPTLPSPAPSEQLAACSPEGELLMESLLRGEHGELLSEALQRLQQAQLRLPPTLLPLALDYGTRSTALRAALFCVLGERGRWLSQFNKAWSWVAQFLPISDDDASLHKTEPLWDEGTLGQRCELLLRWRARNPALARERLQAVWKMEKADARTKLLATLEHNLSPEDEPFLETTLDDRADSVRTLAASLLKRIPSSALTQRMIARADALLDYSQGTLMITLPQDLHLSRKEKRDGIEDSPRGANVQAWYLLQVLPFVPPSHWEARFCLSPDELIHAAHSTEWEDQLAQSWLQATIRFSAQSWIAPLWQWCHQHPGSAATHQALAEHMISQEVAEHYVQQMPPGTPEWNAVLPLLPSPWSADFGLAYLDALRTFVTTLTSAAYQQSYEWYPQSNPWYQSLSVAVHALPAACFPTALRPWTVPDLEEDVADQQLSTRREVWQQELQRFTEILHIRQRIVKEFV